MRDTAFRIRIPKAIHNTSVPQFVVDLSQNVAEVARVQIPQGTKAGDSIVIDLPKAGINFGVVLPTGRYGKYITVRVPSDLNAFKTRKQMVLALTDKPANSKEDGDGVNDENGEGSQMALVLEPDTLIASNVEVQKVVREVFESIDVDGSGSIDQTEMQLLLARLSRTSGDKGAVIFDEIDENHDAVIDPREFETYILKQLAHTSRSVSY